MRIWALFHVWALRSQVFAWSRVHPKALRVGTASALPACCQMEEPAFLVRAVSLQPAEWPVRESAVHAGAVRVVLAVRRVPPLASSPGTEICVGAELPWGPKEVDPDQEMVGREDGIGERGVGRQHHLRHRLDRPDQGEDPGRAPDIVDAALEGLCVVGVPQLLASGRKNQRLELIQSVVPAATRAHFSQSLGPLPCTEESVDRISWGGVEVAAQKDWAASAFSRGLVDGLEQCESLESLHVLGLRRVEEMHIQDIQQIPTIHLEDEQLSHVVGSKPVASPPHQVVQLEPHLFLLLEPGLLVEYRTAVPLLLVRPLSEHAAIPTAPCLLYTSDAADEEDSVDLGGRRIIKKKKKKKRNMRG
eukprot:TRINITY_DN28321_c0_g1_i2.p1 TRINITY_DN28321_c0_g1~~TRINITY_DN28321_c0_g1_i2.p1  ORF type:complete len:361 (+),score=32.86 TRINITY_DN28321_c0_g1_i2:559-1641(+)